MTPRVSGALVIISMVLTGCFGAYQVAPEAPLGVGGLKPTQEDQDAGRVGIATGFNLKDYPVIAVERFPVAKSEIEDQGDQRFADRMAFFYQAELIRRLREAGLFSRVVNLSETDLPVGADKVLKLRGTITRLGRGSQAVRYLVGFGAGSTRAQAEMYFVDADSGQVMLVTADRRLASMGMFGGDDEDFLRESFNNMARDLVKFLTRLPKDFKVAVVAAPPQSTAPEIAPASAKVKALVGTWSGTIYAQRATYPLTITFRDDGSWHATSPTLKPGTFSGTWQLNGSNVVWTSLTTGRTGTSTLHEVNGTRILRLIPDDGTSTIELTPAR